MRLISLMVAIVLPKAVKRGTDVYLTPVTENACRQPFLRTFEQGRGSTKLMDVIDFSIEVNRK